MNTTLNLSGHKAVHCGVRHDRTWERALNVPRDDDLFPFWSSLALELLARAALAHAHPTLVADSSEPDGVTLLHALGFEPKVKNFIPKTLRYVRLSYASKSSLILQRSTSRFVVALLIKETKNYIAEVFLSLNFSNDLWLPRFYESCTALLKFQSKDLSRFL